MTDRPTDKAEQQKALRKGRTGEGALSRKDFLKLSAAGLAVTALGVGGADLPSAAASETAETMRTREIPASGESLPVIGLGTWQQFDVAEDAQKMEALTEVVRRLFDNGGSVIDSSPMYGAAEAGSVRSSPHSTPMTRASWPPRSGPGAARTASTR
ncbi:hypothetical protein [Fodinicurvata halophila]|uniref:hypothetical protein n=1 Tax=Fodinicurvata halophila TaxID=1419723 RepID=UPI00362A6145